MTPRNIVSLRQNLNAAVSLIWLPHAGGSAAFFQEMSSLLPEDIDCSAVEYPGRGRRSREPLCCDLMRIVREVGESLAVLPPKPLVLFGHSMGAIVGFEACRWLRSMGAKNLPKLHIFSSCDPPHVARDRPLLHKMSNVDLLDALVSMGGVSARGEAEELLKLTLPIIRSDLSASEVHRFLPLSRLNERIAVYSGEKDILVRQNILPRWANLTWGSTSLQTFDGGHFYMLEQTEEFVARLQEDVLGVL